MNNNLDNSDYAMTLAGLSTLIKLEAGLATGFKMKSVIILFRLASFSYLNKSAVRYAFRPFAALYKIYADFLLGIELPAKTQVGPGLRIHHGVGLVVHGNVRFGKGCMLRQGVTIGNKGDGDNADRLPTIGNNVEFGAGAIVIGGITVGDNSIIGAGVVLTKDVPENSVVVGPPPRILTRKIN